MFIREISVKNQSKMPVNKNAFQRYLFLNRKFRTGRKFTLQELADACEYDDHIGSVASPHTIRKDIAAMRKLRNLDIKAEEGQYWYADKNANFNESRMTEADVSELNRVSQILQQFDYLPQLAGLQNLILKLRNQVGLLGERPEDVIAFEQVTLKGVSFLTPIYNAIVAKRPLSIVYHPFDFVEPMVCLYHPYFLKEFNNRWYVLTYNETNHRAETIALDRILSLDIETQQPYRPAKDKHFAAFFEDILGVTRPEQGVVERIVLRFKPLRAKYVKSKAWHPSQEVVTDIEGRYCDIAFNLIINKELTARILEFGNDIEVIEPSRLREEVKVILKHSLEQYL